MTLKEYNDRRNNENRSNYLVNYLTKTLVCAVIVFTLLILVNLSDKVKEFIKKEVLTTNFNFASINTLYNKYFTNIFKKDDILVNNEYVEETYEEYKDGVKVLNDQETVNLLNSGIVIFIGEKEEYGKTVIIQQSNGIDAWYAGLDDINIKLYDYIEKGTILGSKNDYYYLLFQKDGKFLKYDQVKG